VYKRPEKYTFGYRRDGKADDALKVMTSTPNSVGPGRYVPEASAHTSVHHNFSRWTLPKAGRDGVERRRPDRNQTYDISSGFGSQKHSKNKTGQKCHFGSSTRNGSNKLGNFSDMMQGTTSVKLHHAKW
jgi:hypothetical protein